MQGVPANNIRDKHGNLTVASTTAQVSTYSQPLEPKPITQVSKSFTTNRGELKPSTSWWERTTSPEIQQWIKIDPVIKSVSLGSMATMGAVIIAEGAPVLGDLVTNKAVEIITTESIKTSVAVGTMAGIAKAVLNAPPDVPELPNPTMTFTSDMTEFIIKSVQQFIDNYSQPKNETDEQKPEDIIDL